VIKAFIAIDFQFIDVTGQVITKLSDASIDVVDRVCITWHIQKNRQNNQKITLLRDKTNPTICPVLAALHLVLRARRLSQPDSMPVACYLKKDAITYLTGARIAFHFRAAARAARPNISKDDEQRYSAHSMRVGPASRGSTGIIRGGYGPHQRTPCRHTLFQHHVQGDCWRGGRHGCIPG